MSSRSSAIFGFLLLFFIDRCQGWGEKKREREKEKQKVGVGKKKKKIPRHPLLSYLSLRLALLPRAERGLLLSDALGDQMLLLFRQGPAENSSRGGLSRRRRRSEGGRRRRRWH